jgi:DNA-directed RNA polymerase subunit RPC12/RpoP
MTITDQELFVRCERCGSEVATGIRRTETGLAEKPPGRRRIRCHRCGRLGEYDDSAFYHRTLEGEGERAELPVREGGPG